jgi:hypothetical protein
MHLTIQLAQAVGTEKVVAINQADAVRNLDAPFDIHPLHQALAEGPVNAPAKQFAQAPSTEQLSYKHTTRLTSLTRGSLCTGLQKRIQSKLPGLVECHLDFVNKEMHCSSTHGFATTIPVMNIRH